MINRILNIVIVLVVVTSSLTCVVVTAGAEGLSVVLEADKSEYAIGEPIKLRVTLRNDSAATIRIVSIADLGMNMRYMRYHITDATGRHEVCFSQFIQVFQDFDPMYYGEPLGPGQEVVTFLYPGTVIRDDLDGGSSNRTMSRVLFYRPGEYTLSVAYQVPNGYRLLWHAPSGGQLSNELKLVVRTADAAETEIFDACLPQDLAGNLGEMIAHAHFDEDALRRVIQKYPDHPKIIYARYALARSLTRIDLKGIAPDAREGIALFEEIRAHDPDFRPEETSKQLATAYFFIGDSSKAVDIFEETLKQRAYLRQEYSFMNRYIHALTGDGDAPRRWREARHEGKRGLEFLQN